MLIFDGDCGVCTRSANFARRIGRGRIKVQPWQRSDLAALGLTEAECGEAVQWVAPDGRTRAAHHAVAAALRAAGGLWGVLGVIGDVPPIVWIAAPLYRVIARNRHRLPGGTPACAVEPPREPD